MTLEILTSDLLGDVRHGFFTRRGGVSSGIFAGLNCGAGSSDQAEAVQMNRRLVAEAMEVSPQNLVSVHQVHSADVTIVDGPFGENPPPKSDAIVTNTPGLAISILTADCQPVLFSDANAGVIGAAHAGWRGAMDGVLEATVNAMVSIGADRDNINAIIGPCISQSAYEVGQGFFEEFIAENPENHRFFANGIGGKYQFDLPGFGLHRLREAAVRDAEWCRHCTYNDPDRFFSYRRATHLGEADYGRLIASISL